jgi:hypothetical protein
MLLKIKVLRCQMPEAEFECRLGITSRGAKAERPKFPRLRALILASDFRLLTSQNAGACGDVDENTGFGTLL